MSKIMCDICGTMYPENAESCPICGCSRDSVAELLGEELLVEETVEETKAGKFAAKKKKEIFDFDEVNSEENPDPVIEEPNPYEEEEEYEERGNHNVLVVIILTIVIALLLGAAGFIFFKYFLPNTKGKDSVEPTVQIQQEATLPPTTVNEIPCEMLILSSGTAELTQEGQHFLIHVQASPSDTTDKIIYTSEDESIAIVSEDGRITAVGEGETVINITCGNIQTPCTVTVKFEEETQPATTEATVPATEETVPGETKPEESTPVSKPDVVLKLEKEDIRLGVYYYSILKLDCDLEPTDVQWTSEHPHIATVDENGKVTAKKEGVTSIVVKYGDQEVKCMVRCVPVN